MNKKIACLSLFYGLAAAALATGASAQTIAYRQANFTSSVSSGAPGTSARLSGPGAIAFLPGQPFFIADSGAGSIRVENPSGSGAAVIGVASASGNVGQPAPLGIASDASGAFGPAGSAFQYVVVTEDGTLQGFAIAGGKTPAATTLVRDDSAVGAVYTAVALVHPDCCSPFAAVANFEDGAIHTFSSSFEPLNLPGSFHDPNLPDGYAPFGLELIGKQLFVAYAVQNAAKNAAIAGAGNGIVDIFDLQGNFVRRLAVGGSLNAPWGITIASANFGPLSGAVLVGNSGDGTISAFDSATGNFLGQVTDGDGNPIVNAAIRGLAFRSDGATDPNTLFFTAANANGGGLFGAITAGLVSATRASASSRAANKGAVITATVAAGPGNNGTPTGTAMVSDGGVTQGAVMVMNGVATFTLPGMKAGMHTILVQYGGDAAFLPSSSQTEMHVAAATTPSFTLTASPSSVTVSAGQSAQITLTVTPSGGFASSVSFSCTSVPGVTCTFSPATVTPSSGPVTTAVTVNAAMGVPRYGSLPFGLAAGAGGSLAALVLLMLPFWRSRNLQRSRMGVLATLGMLFLFAASLTIAGCGSYSAPQNAGPASLTITAMSGSISQTATVSLTVQ